MELKDSHTSVRCQLINNLITDVYFIQIDYNQFGMYILMPKQPRNEVKQQKLLNFL